jgi:hypothetical protein
MSDSIGSSGIGRRQVLKYAGGAVAVVAGSTIGTRWLGKTLKPLSVSTADAAGPPANMFLGGTDGWIYLPPDPPIGFFHPDNYAPPLLAPRDAENFTTYMFGFRNITDLNVSQRANQKNHAQHNAPLFWVKQYNPSAPVDFTVDLTNLGLAQRPDLFDTHTLHWHGFRNVIPFFDGEPTGSVSVPTGTVFRYAYRPRDPGTYMYHCHVEDTEHVHMGMTGIVFVRPLQDGTNIGGLTKFLYNDGDGSTGFHREYVMFMSEVWAEAHWADAHIQLPEWSDYRPDFSLLNGRVYPDTVAPPAPFPLTMPGTATAYSHAAWVASGRSYYPMRTDSAGDLVPNAGYEHLQYQPLSSLVQCNAGEKVALRFANLGFREGAMTLSGIPMTVVGKDATPMRGRDGTNTSYATNTLSLGAGESFDVIFTAPAHSGGVGPDTYMLYDRAYKHSNNLATGGFGGQATEIRVHPAGTLPAQIIPNT